MRSGFFNSEITGYDAENMPIFDRAEDASFFAKFFNQFISNGVFPNPSTNMQVLADTGMQIKVSIGTCFINGYMGWVENAEIKTIEESDIQARIDRVVARLDFDERKIDWYIKKGTASGNPVAPELQRDYDIYEIGLADIRVNANIIEIKQENITDLRLNTELCGIVANQLQHVDTTTLFNQYQSWLDNIIQEGETWLENTKEEAQANIENMQEEFEQEFNEWFETLENTLSGDVAGNLYNLINTKADKKKVYNITIDTTWTEEAPYTKNITVQGISSTDIVNMYPIWSTNLVTRTQEKEEYSKISMITSNENSIELTCDEDKPSIALNVRIEVVY